MKRWNLMSQILVGAWAMLVMTLAYAGTPLWTFEPRTATTVNVPANGTVTIKYLVTNQSRTSHTLVMSAIPGITQVKTAGNCPSPFSLAYQKFCILTLQVNGSSISGNVVGGPVVCQQGNPLQCYQPSLANSLNITKNKAANHTVGGNITGLTGTVTLLNNGTNATPISTDGTFTFSTSIAEGNTYAVTVGTQPTGQTCTVANGSNTMGGANVTDVTVTCSKNAYTVGGSVTGLSGTVTLINNGSDPTQLSTNGLFAFATAVADGSTYAVTIITQPPGHTCSVAHGTGTIRGANVSNVSVTCSTNTYTVGGSVTVLSGTVILLNNGSDPTSISTDGPFTFATAVADGSAYAVTVDTQPPGQTC
ncbi:MAG: hypothetical protein PSV35_03910, partial [bacterium]|nr:hypothetical protein [bacterium]